MTTREFVVRPYSGVDDVQHVLEGCFLDVGHLRVGPGQQLAMTASEYSRAEVEFVPPPRGFVSALEAGTAAAGVDPVDAELLVAVVAKRLKVTELVVRTPLVGLQRADRSFRLATAGRRPLALRAPHGGCDIEVSLVLNRQLRRSSARPWRKGTWLGQVAYSIRTELATAGFSPIP